MCTNTCIQKFGCKCAIFRMNPIHRDLRCLRKDRYLSKYGARNIHVFSTVHYVTFPLHTSKYIHVYISALKIIWKSIESEELSAQNKDESTCIHTLKKADVLIISQKLKKKRYGFGIRFYFLFQLCLIR